MNRINKQGSSNKRKALVATAVVVLLLVGGAIGYALWVQNNKSEDSSDPATSTNDATVKSTDATRSEAEYDAAAKKAHTEDEKNRDGDRTYTEPSVSNSDISLTAQTDADKVTVLTRLAGIPSGECVLHIVNGDKEHSQTAQVMFQPQYSSCAGFSIPKSTLGVGTWSITLTVKSPLGEFQKNINHTVT